MSNGLHADDVEMYQSMLHEQNLKRMSSTRKWDVRFLKLANHVAEWSKDPSTKVGAVLTLDRKVISLGYNGFPAGCDDSKSIYNNRPRKYERVVHAEMNCLLQSPGFIGTTMFCTHPPCPTCCGAMINSGVKRIVTGPLENELAEFWDNPGEPEDGIARWFESLRATRGMLEEAGVIIDFLK